MKNLRVLWLLSVILAAVGTVVLWAMLYPDNSAVLQRSVNAEPAVPVGQTVEFLLVSEGEPSEIQRLAGASSHLESYYYLDSHTTYIVNTETGYICSAAMGKHTANCSGD